MFSLINGNALHLPLADNTVQCIATSVPYWNLRDYGTARFEGGDPHCNHQVGRFEYKASAKQKSNNGSAGHQARTTCPKCGARRIDQQIGQETTPEEYVDNIVTVARELRRVLRPDGTFWLNIGDTWANDAKGPRGADKSTLNGGGDYQLRATPPGQQSGWRLSDWNLKKKDMVGVPWTVALALRADGWYLRHRIVWHKPNAYPSSVTDRPTNDVEEIFLLSKSPNYYYDFFAIKEPQTGTSHSRGNGHHPKLAERNSGIRANESFNTSAYLNVPGGRNARSLWAADGDDLFNWLSQHPQGQALLDEYIELRGLSSVWRINTKGYSGAHFATFAPRLAERMVLAGSSPKACEHCRAPWQRVVERVPCDDPDGYRGSKFTTERKQQLYEDAGTGTRYVHRDTGRWAPTCKCKNNTGSGRCLVFDPFAGTATVGEVCIKHSRNFIGLDLSPEYIGLARQRTHAVQMALEVL